MDPASEYFAQRMEYESQQWAYSEIVCEAHRHDGAECWHDL